MTEVPVLIVGAGGCGLSLTLFLQNLGIESLTIERNPSTADLPRAHILNQRTLEIFAQHGLADAVYAEGSSLDAMAKIRFMTSLGGDGPFDRRVIGDLDGYGGGALRERYEADCAWRATNLPQIQLEPLLRRTAEARAPQSIRFHHELMRLEQDADGVTAWILDHDHGSEYAVRCKYLIGADGGKTVGRLLDVPVDGPRKLRRMVNAFFSADLSPWVDDDQVLLTYFISPDAVGVWGGGGLLKAGPTRWDRHSESWVFMRELHPDDPEELDEANVLQRIRELLRLPDLEITFHKMGGWEVQGVATRHLRIGRVLLAGDAAHRHPPVSALGLNTGFADAHNLAWKLAFVLSGRGGDALLDSYHSERQPVGARVAEWALNGFRVRSLIDAAIGIEPGNRGATRAAFETLFADTAGGATRRAILEEVMRIQRIGPQAHDMELGYRYDTGALVADDRPRPVRDPMASVYYPTTSPGCRLPHAWLEREGKRASTHAFVPRDGFVLFVGADADVWSHVAATVAEHASVRIDVVAVGSMDGWRDADGTWARLREVGEDGVVLVRPDAHVGWRAFTRPDDPRAALGGAMERILDRR